MKRRMTIYNILGIIFLLFQLPEYIGNLLYTEFKDVEQDLGVAVRLGGYWA